MGAEAHAGRARGLAAGRTPAQLFCLLGGALLFGRGVLGYFIVDASFELPGEGWHTTIHLLSGTVLLAGLAAGRAAAAWAAIGFGLFYLSVVVVGIVDGADYFGLIPVRLDDHIFHSAIGTTSLASGLVSRRNARG